jgi:hypothetical protein
VRTHKYRQPHSFKYKNSQTGSKDGAVCVIYSGLLKVMVKFTVLFRRSSSIVCSVLSELLVSN